MGDRYMRAAACVLALSSGVLVTSSAVYAAAGQPQAASSTTSQYPQLPNGPGKDTLIRVCGKCHSPTNVIANGQSRDGWESEITKMAGFGAQASDEEFTEILEYVVKNFPPVTSKVNINKASTGDIETQLGFSTKQAESIVSYRQKNGDFKTLDDLKKVPDLGPSEVDSRRNRIAF